MNEWKVLARPRSSLWCRLFGHLWWKYAGSDTTRHCHRCLQLETLDPKVTEAFAQAWLEVARRG